MSEKQQEFKLPDDVEKAKTPNPRDLVIVSQPKMGKSSIFGDFTKNFNALALDLEPLGYEYVDGRKLGIYPTQDTTLIEAFKNYVKVRNLLLQNKGKYEYLLIDGLSDLDTLSVIGGTFAYMDTVIGKKFNRDSSGNKLEFTDPNFKLVTSLAEGLGYMYSRSYFLEQIDILRQISPFRLYAAHISDKMIKDGGKEEVLGAEISLTGKLKTIFASKVTALAKLIADGDKRYLNFEVANDSIIAGSRSPELQGKILISEKTKDGIVTHWDKIYK